MKSFCEKYVKEFPSQPRTKVERNWNGREAQRTQGNSGGKAAHDVGRPQRAFRPVPTILEPGAFTGVGISDTL